MLGDERAIALADGASIDHLTAAANTAALIDVVADTPGARVVNSADPDTPTAEQIVRRIGDRLDWEGTLTLLEGHADPTVGDHPWRPSHPMVAQHRNRRTTWLHRAGTGTRAADPGNRLGR